MFKRNLVSVSIASVLLSASLAATANTQKDEEEGNDSVKSWGQWANQFATAAGGEVNTSALSFAGFSFNESGRNSQNEAGFDLGDDVDVPGCSAGTMCGFTVFEEGNFSDYGDYGDGIGFFVPGISVDGGEGNGPAVNDGPRRRIQVAFSVDGVVDGSEEYNHQAEGLTRQDEGVFAEYEGDDYNRVIVDDFDEGLFYGSWRTANYADGTFAYGQDYVAGVTTSLDQLNDFVSNLNGAVALYEGSTFDGADFDVSINFSAQSWSGNFENSSKGIDNSFSVTGGKVTDVAFTASSSNLSAATGSVSGIVSGAIFGDSAQSVAGMVDVTKTIGGDVVERETLFAGELQNDLVR